MNIGGFHTKCDNYVHVRQKSQYWPEIDTLKCIGKFLK